GGGGAGARPGAGRPPSRPAVGLRRRGALAGHHLRHTGGQERARVVDGGHARDGLGVGVDGATGLPALEVDADLASNAAHAQARPHHVADEPEQHRGRDPPCPLHLVCACATARARSSAAESGLDSPPSLDYERPGVMSSPIFIGSAFVAQYPTGGGVFWVPLQYLLGLRELGHDAWWLEMLWT